MYLTTKSQYIVTQLTIFYRRGAGRAMIDTGLTHYWLQREWALQSAPKPSWIIN